MVKDLTKEKPAPKKRDRKPKIKDPNEKKKTPKKRGRKKKVIDPNTVIVPKEKIIKKRGRKPTSKLINIKDKDINLIEKDEDCIIAHIPVKMTDIKLFNNKKNTISKDSDDLVTSITDISFDSYYDSKKVNNIYDNKYIQYMEEQIESLKKKIEQLTNNNNNKNNQIFPSDYNNDILENKILTHDGIKNECFLKKTNICCWWCCHQFDNMPFPLPENLSKGIFKVYGVFCSANCAMAYNLELNDYKMSNRNTLIARLYNLIMKKPVDKIYPSQPRQRLRMFGGTTDIDEYRNHNLEICNSRLVLPPMAPLRTLIEESYKDRNKYKWDNVDVEYNRYNKLKNNIKLKRNKPIKNNHNSLEKRMGIRKIKISD